MLTLAALSLISVAAAQKVGRDTAETHPRLNWQQCTSSGCSNVNGEVVIDANWRWFHNGKGFEPSCYYFGVLEEPELMSLNTRKLPELL